MKLAGVLFVVVASGSVGIRIAMGLRKRCMTLQQLLHALQILKNEISFCATPLPQAFALMAAATKGVWETVFSAAAKEMDRQRWTTPLGAMELALRKASVQTTGDCAGAVLLELAAKLGKYDPDSQLQGIEIAEARIRELLHRSEQEQRLRGRTYETLGICAGLAMAILLL